mmetsp:Transcript_144742/g.403324  ORF Transcript_144742/g.403324 Transcript_144742/m.403324 type:complete len:209 (+) Transcript_144742:75-701(+)
MDASAPSPTEARTSTFQPLPIFLTQPDGSLAQAVPPRYKEPSPPSTPPELIEAALQLVQQVTERLERCVVQSHRALLVVLLAGLTSEAAAASRLARGAARQQVEVQKLHPHAAAFHPSDPSLVTAVLISHSLYASVYYSLGFLAACSGHRRLHGLFARLALWGAVVQPLLAVVAGQMSCIVMFQRFAAYVQAGTCAHDLMALDAAASR